ncbi:hypothetical protein B1M_32067 [Burkholderia sp. TJI49]|nr:hypothetical protein B1M_32067 [Burkholderia sp. TJI49]
MRVGDRGGGNRLEREICTLTHPDIRNLDRIATGE